MLDDVNDFRKVALEISKSAAREGKLGDKKTEIMQTMDWGYSRMEEHFLTNGSVLEDLTEIQKSLRSLPIVQLHLPTVVLVREGALCVCVSVCLCVSVQGEESLLGVQIFGFE